MRRWRGRSLAAAVAAILAGACGDSTSDHTTLTLVDNGATVALAVGDTLDVQLDTVGPFYFGTPVVSTAAVRFVRESDQVANPPNPGGGMQQRYFFAAVTRGDAQVTIPRQIPEPNPPGFAVTVRVY